jgi:hypothetical protein
MKTFNKTILLTLPLWLSTLAIHAQNYSIDWYNVSGGGGTSTGGQFSLSGAIGQPDVGAMAGGSYSLTGGFLSLGAAAPTPPAIVSVMPGTGPTSGGTMVTIVGTGFESGATVDFGASPALSVDVINSTNITALTPPSGQGTVQVVVANPGGQSATLANAFTYVAQPGTPVITWANPAPIVYGAALGSSQLNATANVPGSFAYSPAAGAVLNSGAATLEAVFTPNDTVDYTSATANASLVVLPAPLSVTASNATRAYGQANPVFNGTITGLVNGDNITATYGCAATTASPPGTYPIVPSLVDPDNRQGNYQVTLVNGTLTVTPAAPQAILSITPATGRPNGTVTLAWSATPGQVFQVQYKTNLSQPDWVNLATVTATSSTATVSDSLNSSAQRFYRTVWLP